MANVYIGIGGNLENPALQVQQAIERLPHINETTLVSCSSLYSSKPMGPQDQPDYVNAVAQLNTSLSPLALLDELQAIEQAFGRQRVKDNRWGARVLDLDILLIDNLVIDSSRLTVPHYDMKSREFVLLPLLEIAPQLSMPDGCTIKTLSDNIDHNGLIILSGI